MINTESLRAGEQSSFGSHFVKPLCDTYCFANIPQCIRFLLTDTADPGLPADTLGHLAGNYERVIFVLVDGYGWRFLQHAYEHNPFLRRIAHEGVISRLTAQFPSTTTAHMTTLHTGLPVGQSGIYEWFYYEPLLDSVIAPLLFSYAGDSTPGTLQQSGVAPTQLFPQRTLYHDLQEQGVAAFLFGHRAYVHSPYSQVVTAGAEIIPYTTLPEALVNLTQHLTTPRGRCYYGLYFDSIDAISHKYGPESPQVAAEIDLFLMAMEHLFHQVVADKLTRTLLLITADHGQVATDPAATIYLNYTAPQVKQYLKTTRSGQLIVPAGSSRDMFLSLEERFLDEASAYLRERLEGRAEVHRVADLVDQGFFGPGTPAPAFHERVGNLVILPYANESVWWYEKDRFEHTFRGHHGGLTREELEIGLLALGYGVDAA